MTRSQFIFSLLSGASAMGGGFMLATAGVADWGLFWVGSAIAAVATFTAVKINLADGALRLRGAVPVPVER